MKILVIGNSKHLNEAIFNAFESSEIKVVQWRNSCRDFGNLKYDLVFIVGFDYKSYMMGYSEYARVNINNPILKLINLCKYNPDIIYINTEYSKRTFTFSRYRYAKEELGSKIIENFPNSYVIRFETFVDQNGELKINADCFSRKVINFLVKIKIIKTISMNNVSIRIANYKNNSTSNVLKIKGLFIKKPRTQIIDRLLRIIIG